MKTGCVELQIVQEPAMDDKLGDMSKTRPELTPRSSMEDWRKLYRRK